MEAAPSSHHLSSSLLLAAATILKAIIEAAEAEKSQSLPVDEIDQRANEREKQEQQWQEAHQTTVNPPALSSEAGTSRRPGRPLRKRERRDIHFSEGCHADPSSPVHQPPRKTMAGPYAWRSSNAAINANDMVAPRSPLLPFSSAQTSGHGQKKWIEGVLGAGKNLALLCFLLLPLLCPLPPCLLQPLLLLWAPGLSILGRLPTPRLLLLPCYLLLHARAKSVRGPLRRRHHLFRTR